MLGNVVNKKTYWQCSFESLLIYSQVNALNLKTIPQLSAVSDLNKYDLEGNLKKKSCTCNDTLCVRGAGTNLQERK